MTLYALIGLSAGAAVMLAVRQAAWALWLVPIAVAIGPLLMRLRGLKPSRTFVILYVISTTVVFTVLALLSPGFRSSFDPP